MKLDSRARKIFGGFPDDVKNYFIKLDKKCQKYGVILKIGGGKALNAGGRCGGYFDYSEKVLAIAIGSENLGNIITILVHEQVHCFKQWLNPRSIWHKKGIIRQHARFAHYLKGNKIYRPLDCAIATIKLELDCERKTLRELNKWQKYVDINVVTQLANAYILSHWKMLELKKWPTKSTYNKKILAHCSNVLIKDYRKIPERLKMAFDRYL